MTDEPIWRGEFRDEAWLALVAKSKRGEDMTPDEINRYIRGPRQHPFDHAAYCLLVEGRVAYFRSKEAADAYAAAHGIRQVTA